MSELKIKQPRFYFALCINAKFNWAFCELFVIREKHQVSGISVSLQDDGEVFNLHLQIYRGGNGKRGKRFASWKKNQERKSKLHIWKQSYTPTT